MSGRILIVGAGANQVGIIEKARALGLFTIAMDGNPCAPGFAVADAYAAANILDPHEIVRLAETHGAGGIYPAAELAVEAAAQAAAQLDLPGPGPEVATCVRNKLAMRRALDSAGLPNPAYRGVRTLDEARRAVAEIGFPVIVKPIDGNASKGVRRVDTEEDLPGTFEKALERSRSNAVLIEAFMEGEEFNVDGLVHEGAYILGGITAKDRSVPPNRFDLGIYMPPLESADTLFLVADTVADALGAIGFRNGTTHAEVIVSPEGPHIVEIAGRPGGGRIPTDLIPLTYGTDFMADSLRIALGHPPIERRRHERGTAVYWIPADPGTVVSIEGVDEARAVLGVEDIVIAIRRGDRVEPIIDCVTRDRIGYVMTAADTVEDAIAAAKRARDLCRIITQPASDA